MSTNSRRRWRHLAEALAAVLVAAGLLTTAAATTGDAPPPPESAITAPTATTAPDVPLPSSAPPDDTVGTAAIPSTTTLPPVELAAAQWQVVELDLAGAVACPASCYLHQSVSAVFTPPAGTRVPPVTVAGFVTGAGAGPGTTWAVRFTPTAPGRWTFETRPGSPDPGLSRSGSVTASSAPPGRHGFLRAVNRGFRFDDGTPFFMLGSTYYTLVGEQRYDPASAHATLVNTRAAGITKIRVLVYPWASRPVTAPFTDANSAHVALDQVHFAALDTLVSDAQAEGLQIDLELFADTPAAFFCPGRCAMSTAAAPCSRVCPGWPGPNATDDNYVRYVVARYGAYANVEWVLSNEFEYTPYTDVTPGLAGATPTGYWDHIGSVVAAADPYMTSTTLAGARRPTAINGTTNWPTRGSGATVMFAQAAVHGWQSSTALQYHQGQCAAYPGSPGSVVASDVLSAGPIENAANRATGLPLVVDEWSYVTDNRDRCATAANATNDVSIRWGIWAAAAVGGYTSIGDSSPSGPSWNLDITAPVFLTGKWQDGPRQGVTYGATTYLSAFFAAHADALSGLTLDGADTIASLRVYASSAPGGGFVAYSAVSGPIGLTLAAGIRYAVSAYNVTTGATVALPGVTAPVTGTGARRIFTEPAGMGQAGDWAIYAAPVTGTGPAHLS